MLPTLCACAQLRRSARIVSALYDEALEPCGLSVAQFSLLRLLKRAGPSTLTQFAEAAGYDRTTLNRTLKPLDAAGLVASSPSPDKRARIVTVTDKGEAVMRQGQPHWEAAQKRIEDKLGPDHAVLFSILDRIEELRA